MKELDPIQPDKKQEKTEIHAQATQEAENIYRGTMKLQRGQRLWAIDMTEELATVKPVDVTPEKKQTAYVVKGGKTEVKSERKITMDPKCFYCVAVNPRNAIAKYVKFLIQTRKKS